MAATPKKTLTHVTPNNHPCILYFYGLGIYINISIFTNPYIKFLKIRVCSHAAKLT